MPFRLQGSFGRDMFLRKYLSRSRDSHFMFSNWRSRSLVHNVSKLQKETKSFEDSEYFNVEIVRPIHRKKFPSNPKRGFNILQGQKPFLYLTTCTAQVGEYSRVWVHATHYYLMYDINTSATVTLDDAGTCKKHVLKRVGQKQVDLHRSGTVTGPWQNRGKTILQRGKAKL